jgi:uncharacterized protein (DUF433 family)
MFEQEGSCRAMQANTVRIVDVGRGPQIEGHRLTVLDVFYYLHRGNDFDFIQRALPSLSREDFDAVLEYVNEHRDELIDQDRRADEFIRRGCEEQKAKGLAPEINATIPAAERAANLRDLVAQRAERERGDTAR